MTDIEINTRTTNSEAYRLYLQSQGVTIIKERYLGDGIYFFRIPDPPAGYEYNLRKGLSQGYQDALFNNERIQQEQILKQQQFREAALASGTGQSTAAVNPQTGVMEGYETYTEPSKKIQPPTVASPFKNIPLSVVPEPVTQPSQPSSQPANDKMSPSLGNFALTSSFYKQKESKPLATTEEMYGFGWTENMEQRRQFAESPGAKIAYTLTEGSVGFGTMFEYGKSALSGESYQAFYDRESMKRQLWLREGEIATQKGRAAEFYFGTAIQGSAAIGLGMAGSGLLGSAAKTGTSYATKTIVGSQFLYTAQTFGSEESGRNVAGLFMLAAAESLGRMPIKYREVRIPVEQSDKVVWRGMTLEVGKRAEPVIGINANRIVSVRTPKVDFSLADQGKPIIPSSLSETEIMRRNLRTQLSPEDFALWNKGTKLPRYTELTPSKDINQLPAKTEALSERGVAAQNAFVKKKGATEYGSYTAYAQRSEKINAGFKTPGDQDIQFALGIGDEKAGKMIERELLPRLKESDQARLAAERKTLVESKPLEAKDWRHAGDFHTGADALAEELPKYKMFGYRLAQPDIKLKSREGDLISAMPLSEQGIRDLNIFSLQVREVNGKRAVLFGPEEKRLKDIPKFIVDQKQLIESKWSPRTRGKAQAELEEIERGLRARFPEAFKELNAGKQISEPPSYPRYSKPPAYDASMSVSKVGMMQRYAPKPSKSRSDASLRAMSLSISASPSISRSLSISPSKSPSPSPSFSKSKSPSLSRSKSTSLSKSMSPSYSRSPSPSQSYSPSPSQGKSKPKGYLGLVSGSAKSKAKVHMTDSERKQLLGYYPSLTGLFSGKSIAKAPKGTLTGVEIRYPVRPRKVKFL